MHKLKPHKGYKYKYEYDSDEDNIKIYHLAITPDGNEIFLDLCVYSWPTQEEFNKIVIVDGVIDR